VVRLLGKVNDCVSRVLILAQSTLLYAKLSLPDGLPGGFVGCVQFNQSITSLLPRADTAIRQHVQGKVNNPLHQSMQGSDHQAAIVVKGESARSARQTFQQQLSYIHWHVVCTASPGVAFRAKGSCGHAPEALADFVHSELSASGIGLSH
jgi:hypothetical protein